LTIVMMLSGIRLNTSRMKKNFQRSFIHPPLLREAEKPPADLSERRCRSNFAYHGSLSK
jgi:hypothetical protein